MDNKNAEEKINAMKAMALSQKNSTGPDRKMLLWEEPHEGVMLNAFSDHPQFGNELDFVRVRRYGATYRFSTEIDLVPFAVYEFLIFLHNTSGDVPARGVSVNLKIPFPASQGDSNELRAVVGCLNAVPHVIWSSCRLKCRDRLKLEMLLDSGSVVNLQNKAKRQAQVADLFWITGLQIEEEDGDIISDSPVFIRFLAVALPLKEDIKCFSIPEKKTFLNGVQYVGAMKNGLPDGQGIMSWPGGESYEGEWVRNNRHGYGQLKKEGSLVYDGQWADDKRCGEGTQYLPDGSRYEGFWKDDQRYGTGTLFCSDGTVFQGVWESDSSCEKGSIQYSNGDRYEGAWKRLRRNGKGLLTWADGSSYDGEWIDDVINGTGKMICTNMDIHAGHFINGLKHGKCVSIYAGREMYDGFYEDDRRNGTGTYIWENGDRYIGEWMDDLRDGRGTQTYQNGSIYEGQWAKGKRNGYGVLKSASGGVIYSGEWIDDEPKPNREAPDELEERMRLWAKEYSLSDFHFRSEFQKSIMKSLKFCNSKVRFEDVVAIQTTNPMSKEIRGSVFTPYGIYSNLPPQGFYMSLQSVDTIDLTEEGIIFWFGEHKFMVDFGEKNRDTAIILLLLTGKQLG